MHALRLVALEMSDAVDADGYTVEQAMAVNSKFTSGTARAHLLRDIVNAGAAKGASPVGIWDYRTVNGTGVELRHCDGQVQRHLRIRRARLSGGELRIRANSDSALIHVADPDQLLLIPEQQWVLGWHLDEGAGQIDEVFVAQVLGVDDSGGNLELGPQYRLLEPPTPKPGRRFDPNDGGIPGFDTGADEAGDTDYGAGS